MAPIPIILPDNCILLLELKSFNFINFSYYIDILDTTVPTFLDVYYKVPRYNYHRILSCYNLLALHSLNETMIDLISIQEIVVNTVKYCSITNQ